MNKIILTEFNVHRMFFSSLLLAIKYNEDNFYTNKFYSNVSGLKCSELNNLELKFVTEIKFDLFVDKNLYEMELMKDYMIMFLMPTKIVEI